ncbi:MAG: hypothetical protein QG650_592 [Patescibacteria group bacterium]|nr:hypothetical protein [Patescibacteria group bacterium]
MLKSAFGSACRFFSGNSGKEDSSPLPETQTAKPVVSEGAAKSLEDIEKGLEISPAVPSALVVSEETANVCVVEAAETTGSPDISEHVKKSVDGLLDPDDIQKIRYFFTRLFREFYDIVPEVEKLTYGDGVKLKLPGAFKGPASVSRIVLDYHIKNEAKILEHNSLRLGNLVVTVESGYSSTGTISVKIEGKVRDKDIESLRIFVENFFLSEFSINETSVMDAAKIRSILELPDSDFVSFDGKVLEIRIQFDSEPNLSHEFLEAMTTVMNNSLPDYGTKYAEGPYSILGTRRVSVRQWKGGEEYVFNISSEGTEVTIKTSASYGDISINRALIETAIKRMIHILSKSASKKGYLDRLRDYGVMVYEKDPGAEKESLENLYVEEGFVGYEDIKEEVATNVVFPWERREEYLDVSRKEFARIKNIIPNAALFEGPPGTGKTTCAKIIGRHLGYPFVYVPIAKIMSKWYSEAEARLDAIFDLAGKAAESSGGIVMMIDEIDEIGKNREESHEATGRITGVLLKKLDGIEKVQNLLLIGSTNRKDAMDPALLSRFARQVYFRNPNENEAKLIFGHYLPAATAVDPETLAVLDGKSGRDIRNLSEDVARKYLQRKVIEGGNPDMSETIEECLSKLKPFPRGGITHLS